MFLQPSSIWNKKAFCNFKKFSRFTLLKIWEKFDLARFHCRNGNMKSFYENYNLKSLIKQPTYYKNPNKPTCIDLTLTNVHACFKVHV